MKFLNTDFFLHTFEEGLFDGIITDPPYKNV
jgi:DNA modification methylase